MSPTAQAGAVATRQSTEATLPCDGRAAGCARRLVVEHCRSAGLTHDAVDSAELLVSEMVTNAVIHGRSDVRLRVCATEHLLRVEVGDDNSRRPARVAPDAEALDGRGMAIIDLLASDWGVEDGAVGKVVWFEIAA